VPTTSMSSMLIGVPQHITGPVGLAALRTSTPLYSTPSNVRRFASSGCPRSLDALILRLLAKDPSERPESATDVLSALEAIDITTSVERPAASVDEAHALDSLAGGLFVGRQREMGDLKAALEDALSSRGRLVTLVGEPGIGKTRTAQELATYAGLRGAQALWGLSYEEQGMLPYWPWTQAIRSYIREREPEQLLSEMGAGAAYPITVIEALWALAALQRFWRRYRQEAMAV